LYERGGPLAMKGGGPKRRNTQKEEEEKKRLSENAKNDRGGKAKKDFVKKQGRPLA